MQRGQRARSKFGTPMFETEVFRKQMYCIEESTCDIVGTFRRLPQWFSVPILSGLPENCAPLAYLRYAPGCNNSFVSEQSTVCGLGPNTNERSNMLCHSISLNLCDFLSNCFVKKLLSDVYIGLSGPYRPYRCPPPLLTSMKGRTCYVSISRLMHVTLL